MLVTGKKPKRLHEQAHRGKPRRNLTEHMEAHRKFLKSDRWEELRKLDTDQKRGVPPPSPQKPYPENAKLISLVSPEKLTIDKMPLTEAIRNRRSRRVYTDEPFTLEELSFLLWATQGVSARPSISKITPRDMTEDTYKFLAHTHAVLRTVPSGGARHPFETYLLVNRVTGVKPGLYRYLPLENKLCLLSADPELTRKVHEANYEQYVENSAVTFIWTAIPYRTEWRYSILSPKIIAQDSGHMCQNLYLACEAIGAGTCAVGAYDQKKMDKVLGVDGKEEFTIYVAPAGKVKSPVRSRPKN
jgi:SagB-type dehydrogenase family enzyme